LKVIREPIFLDLDKTSASLKNPKARFRQNKFRQVFWLIHFFAPSHLSTVALSAKKASRLSGSWIYSDGFAPDFNGIPYSLRYTGAPEFFNSLFYFIDYDYFVKHKNRPTGPWPLGGLFFAVDNRSKEYYDNSSR
jgi:hypothetical protein